MIALLKRRGIQDSRVVLSGSWGDYSEFTDHFRKYVHFRDRKNHVVVTMFRIAGARAGSIGTLEYLVTVVREVVLHPDRQGDRTVAGPRSRSRDRAPWGLPVHHRNLASLRCGGLTVVALHPYTREPE